MSINMQVVQFARSHMNRSVGRGECYDLAHLALESAGAASAPDYGEITPRGDYQWGLGVMLGSVKAGDIVQFRNYRVDIDNEQGTGFETRGNPNHTAIVASVGQAGVLEVFEQNVGDMKRVMRRTLYFQNDNGITVTGQFKFYRPQPRNDD